MVMGEDEERIDHGAGGGTLCLDFANTVDWHASDNPEETLTGYKDLVEWSTRRGLLNKEDAASLRGKGEQNKELGRSVMGEATVLREAIYRIFSATAHGRIPPERELQLLNQYLAKGLSRTRITVDGNRFRWDWAKEDRPLDMMLWPVAKSAADLLTSEDIGRVKECANEEEGCGWVFLDTSRSQNRVWCSMKSCGNRMKFRRFYRAHQGQRGD